MRRRVFFWSSTPASPIGEAGVIFWPSLRSLLGRYASVWGAAVVVGARLLPDDRAVRHACGYKLANDGHDTRAIQAYLGHRNIQTTTRYTALAPQRFKEFFRD
jgi:integrase